MKNKWTLVYAVITSIIEPREIPLKAQSEEDALKEGRTKMVELQTEYAARLEWHRAQGRPISYQYSSFRVVCTIPLE